MVMQLSTDFLVGGSIPGPMNMPLPPQRVGRPGFRTIDHDPCGLLRYHSTSSCVRPICFPTAWSLLSKNF